MSSYGLGILLAFLAAVAWAISPLAWASAGRRVGAFNVMLLRNAIASVLMLVALGVLCATRGMPQMPTPHQWMWVVASGLAGVAIGDWMCFEAYVTLGARHTVQISVLAPVAAAILGLSIGEIPTWPMLAGMVLVLGGVAWAVSRGQEQEDRPNEHGRVTVRGLAFAVGAAICTGLGAVALRVAERDGPLDPVLKTTIRIATAAAFFWAVPLAKGRWGDVLGLMRNRAAALRILTGCVVGVVIGMSCFVAALGLVQPAIATTVVATSPLLLLPLVAWRYGSRIPPSVVVAMCVALGGVALIAFAR